MQRVEQSSILLGFLQDLEENKPITIGQIHEKTQLHFNTIRDNIRTFQSIQEFQFLIKVIEANRHYLVVKIPNPNSLESLESKINKLLKEFETIKTMIKRIKR